MFTIFFFFSDLSAELFKGQQICRSYSCLTGCWDNTSTTTTIIIIIIILSSRQLNKKRKGRIKLTIDYFTSLFIFVGMCVILRVVVVVIANCVRWIGKKWDHKVDFSFFISMRNSSYIHVRTFDITHQDAINPFFAN